MSALTLEVGDRARHETALLFLLLQLYMACQGRVRLFEALGGG